MADGMIVDPYWIAVSWNRPRYCGNSVQIARASTARSRAVVLWPAPGRPCGLMKRVPIIPSRRASRFMSATNAASVPPSISATATATSFADFTISIFSALSTVTTVPGRKPMRLGCCAVACSEIVTGEFMASRPSPRAWKAI